MSWLESPTAILLGSELRTLLRDRRTVFASVVLPVVLLPVILFAGQISERGREKRLAAQTFRYAVVGQAAPWARQLLAETAVIDAREGGTLLTLEETEVEDPSADLEQQTLHFYIETLSDTAPDSSPDSESANVPRLDLVFRGDWDASSTAVSEMTRRLREVRLQRRDRLLEGVGFALPASQVLRLEEEDVATEGQRSGLTLGRFAVLYVLLFMLTGGAVVAADTVAGEKERGTLETLLTTAISRGEIVTAKQLLILIVGIGITLIQVANFLVYIKFDIIELPTGLAVDLSLLQIALSILLFLPLAALTSSVLLWLSGRAKTYKEFQVAFFPVFLLSVVPAAAALLPGISLRSAIALVPIANISVAIKEILVGEIDLLMIAVAFLITSATAVFALRVTQQSLSEERLMTANSFDRADLEGGPALFPRHIWRWYALMWAAVFIAAMNPVMQGLRGQILFNVVGIFLGGSLLMMRQYRLPPREALALRPVKPVVWLAVLIGAPSALISNLLIVKLSAFLFPIPKAWIEQFSQMLTPGDMSLWQILFWVAVLPGICEEVAFRGVLLHGLRKRFHPIVLCLVVGIVFGLFHFDLPRLLPTAMLGIVLAAVTVLSGSIFPAMLWHALNNAWAILAQHYGMPLEELDLPSSLMAVAIAVLAGWLIWRNRTLYPGLKI